MPEIIQHNDGLAHGISICESVFRSDGRGTIVEIASGFMIFGFLREV